MIEKKGSPIIMVTLPLALQHLFIVINKIWRQNEKNNIYNCILCYLNRMWLTVNETKLTSC